MELEKNPLSGVFYKCQLDPVGWWRPSFTTLQLFCLVVLLIELGLFKSQIIIVGLSISPSSSIHFSFTYFAALSFAAYTFRIAMPFIYLFIYLFVWLFGCVGSQLWKAGSLVAACRLVSCGMWTLSCSMHVGSSSWIRDQTQAPCTGSTES